MAGTYGDMQTRIASEVIRTSLTSDIQNAIQSAIQDYEGERLHFNEQTYLIPTTSGTQDYALPASLTTEAGGALGTGETLLEIDSLVCYLNNWPLPLRPVSSGWINAYQSTNFVGQPAYYAFFNNKVRLAPIPNGAYSLKITGLSRLPALSAAGDANAWMTEGEKLIREHAKLILYRDIIRNSEMAQVASMAEAEAFAALKRKYDARQSNRLTAWGY